MLLSTANSDQCRIIAEEGPFGLFFRKAASRFDQDGESQKLRQEAKKKRERKTS
jgi:hypothetical protein